MKRRLVVAVALAALAATVRPAAAGAPAWAYGAHGIGIDLYHRDGAPVEFRMFGGHVRYADSTTGVVEERDFCVEIIVYPDVDLGCGDLEITADPTLETGRVQGTLESQAGPIFDYDARVPSSLTVDLTLTATAAPELRHSEATGVGFCGFPPPQTRGAFANVEVPLEPRSTCLGR